MVQGVFDDLNPATRPMFAYPDGPFDAERNTAEFVAAMPSWRSAGLLAFTVNFQGGSPQGRPTWAQVGRGRGENQATWGSEQAAVEPGLAPAEGLDQRVPRIGRLRQDVEPGAAERASRSASPRRGEVDQAAPGGVD